MGPTAPPKASSRVHDSSPLPRAAPRPAASAGPGSLWFQLVTRVPSKDRPAAGEDRASYFGLSDRPARDGARHPSFASAGEMGSAGGLEAAAGRRSPGWIQTKLTVGQVDDPFEREADQVADAIMREGPAPAPAAEASGGTIQRACSMCEDQQKLRSQIDDVPELQAKGASGALDAATPPVESTIASLSSHGGEPLRPSTRSLLEPRFGRDFSSVHVHVGSAAARAAQALSAKAFTVGSDIFFGSGQYAPSTSAGQHLLAHELAHVAQQGHAAEHGPRAARGSEAISSSRPEVRRQVIREKAAERMISRRLDPSDCASDCAAEDPKAGTKGKYLLTVYADKEGSFLLLPFTSKVGHSWVKLTHTNGAYWTYGFWPQTGFTSNYREDVEGCVHHPDTAHTPTSTQAFELTADQFEAALAEAKDVCTTKPKYNLFSLQCTSFVRRIMKAAGQEPGGGFGLIWDSPNALDAWIRGNALMLGISITPASTGSGGKVDVGADLLYKHRFYSALGEKLRLNWMARGELSSRMTSVSTGLATEFSAQKIYLPSVYVYGGGSAGKLGGPSGKAGAGLSTGAGLLYKIDEISTIGVEYNLVKDLVNEDPALHRFMITARINLF